MTTTERPPPPTTTAIGRARARQEDARLLTGRSRYTDVITPDMNAPAHLLPALGNTMHFAGEGVAVVVAREAASADGVARHLGVTDIPMPATVQRVRCAPRTASAATHQTSNNPQGDAQ